MFLETFEGGDMNVLDMFSGIGGFSLGLERAGMRTVAFCECDPYCQAVLRKHWPDVPVFGDVRTLTAEASADATGKQDRRLFISGIPTDIRADDISVICGGFPCQDISLAGKGAGLDGARSGLWKEFARIIGEVRPEYVIVENVAALLGRGLSQVLGDLAAFGYNAEWHCIPACAVGAPHKRDRLWIIAYTEESGQPRRQRQECAGRPVADGCGSAIPDTDKPGLAQRQEHQLLGQRAAIVGSDWWQSEPDVGRVAHGVPSRVDRLRALGNAVVPQITEIIGKAIMQKPATGRLERGLSTPYRARPDPI